MTKEAKRGKSPDSGARHRNNLKAELAKFDPCPIHPFDPRLGAPGMAATRTLERTAPGSQSEAKSRLVQPRLHRFFAFEPGKPPAGLRADVFGCRAGKA